jgi:rSAM/selenodomain-associated transferase 1
MRPHLLVLAKAPVPGRVKTRLCPPCTPEQAARVAAAALADTIDTVDATPATARTLVVEGASAAPPGWGLHAQRGGSLGERIVHAYADTRIPRVPSLLIGMDTPQVTAALLIEAGRLLAHADAVLGPAADGGWWALGLNDPIQAGALRDVPTSTSDTGALTVTALRAQGLRVALLPELRDVDTATDAGAVAALCPPGSRFASAVRLLVAPGIAA